MTSLPHEETRITDLPALDEGTAVEDIGRLVAAAHQAPAAVPAPYPAPVGQETGLPTKLLDLGTLDTAQPAPGARPHETDELPVTGARPHETDELPVSDLPSSSKGRPPARRAPEVGSAWANPKVPLVVGAVAVAFLALVLGNLLHSFYTAEARPSRNELAYLYPYRDLQAQAPNRQIPRGRELRFTFEEEVPCPHGRTGCLRYSYSKDGFSGSMVVHRAGPGEDWQRVEGGQR